jgi:hypothetical protein
MKIIETTRLIHSSKDWTLFIIVPTLLTLLTKRKENNMTGSPVAKAKTAGMTKLSPD